MNTPFFQIFIILIFTVLLYFLIRELWRLLFLFIRRVESKKHVLYSEIYKELIRKCPNTSLALLEIEAAKLFSRWEKLRFISFRDKVAAIQAGYSNYNVRAAYRVLGREALYSIAALRVMGNR